MRKYIVPFLVLVFIGIAFLQGFFFWGSPPPSTDQNYITIEIPQGATFREVTDLLFEEALISNRFSFRLLGKLTRNETRVKPGEYRLHRAMRPKALLGVLVRGEILHYQVVIPEGMSSREIAQMLESANLVDAEIFQELVHDQDVINTLGFEGESLEGYLFPETYRFSKQSSPRQIVTQITKQFNTIYDASFQQRAEALGMTQREVVTLASIIEKETAVAEERPIVSAVFHNRLKKNMRLQSDPTVIFSLKHFDGNLTRNHLLNDSPYNTYKVVGLPPGPIANPGRDAIHAALHPAAVDYLYFVSKNNGAHYFSKTLKEHNAAVRKFQLGETDLSVCPNCAQENG
ncbi:MAG: endolytic transglycosylase MltG [Nitrospiria bacterium]